MPPAAQVVVDHGDGLLLRTGLFQRTHVAMSSCATTWAVASDREEWRTAID